jgi:hypothetical protein
VVGLDRLTHEFAPPRAQGGHSADTSHCGQQNKKKLIKRRGSQQKETNPSRSGEKLSLVKSFVQKLVTKNPKMQHFNDQSGGVELSDRQYRALEQSWLSYVQGEREKEGMEHLADTNCNCGILPAQRIPRTLLADIPISKTGTGRDRGNSSNDHLGPEQLSSAEGRKMGGRRVLNLSFREEVFLKSLPIIGRCRGFVLFVCVVLTEGTNPGLNPTHRKEDYVFIKALSSRVASTASNSLRLTYDQDVRERAGLVDLIVMSPSKQLRNQ